MPAIYIYIYIYIYICIYICIYTHTVILVLMVSLLTCELWGVCLLATVSRGRGWIAIALGFNSHPKTTASADIMGMVFSGVGYPTNKMQFEQTFFFW